MSQPTIVRYRHYYLPYTECCLPSQTFNSFHNEYKTKESIHTTRTTGGRSLPFLRSSFFCLSCITMNQAHVWGEGGLLYLTTCLVVIVSCRLQRSFEKKKSDSFIRPFVCILYYTSRGRSLELRYDVCVTCCHPHTASLIPYRHRGRSGPPSGWLSPRTWF